MSSRLCKSSLPILILAKHATNIATHWFRIKCSKIRQFEKVLPVLYGDIMNLAIVMWLGYFKTKLFQFILLTISLYFQVLKIQRFIHSLILCRISLGWGKRFCYMKEIQVYGFFFRRRGEKKKTESKQIKFRSALFFIHLDLSQIGSSGCKVRWAFCVMKLWSLWLMKKIIKIYFMFHTGQVSS